MSSRFLITQTQALIATAVFGLLNVTSVWAVESEPVSPADSLKHFEIEDGYEIELVASEPLVVDPVAISFDHLGRMYVAEYRDYPLGPPDGGKPQSVIKRLEDTNGDGTFDQATEFAQVPWAQGVLAHRNGVIVTASPQVIYLEDQDGDGVADYREVLIDGFAFGNPQLRVGHPIRGLDQKIYLTNGLSGGEINVPDEQGAIQKLVMGRSDVSYDPLKKTIQLVPGQAQFGNTFDDFGNRFFCTNRNPIIYAPLSMKTLNRNPFAPVIEPEQNVAPFGGNSRVYPRIETKTTAVSHAGTHTAASGTGVSRGGLFGDEENVFVCEPTGSLVTRTILTVSGSSFASHRTQERKDFLTSSDPWCRPVSVADGPDGNLYVVDMYREVIEHPNYMPPGLAETLRLRAGETLGRIYRIRKTGKKSEPWAAATSVSEYLSLMDSENGWKRDLAQRKLIELADPESISAISTGLIQRLSSDDPKVVVQSLWTLVGLYRAEKFACEHVQSIVEKLLKTQNLHVLEHAIRVTSEIGLPIYILEDLEATDPRFSARVALFWIDATAESAVEQTRITQGQLIARYADDVWIRRLALTLPPINSSSLLSQLLNSEHVLDSDGESQAELIFFLANIIGRLAEENEVSQLLEAVTRDPSETLLWWQAACIFGLEKGLAEGSGISGQKSIAALAELTENDDLKSAASRARTLAQTGVNVVADPSAKLAHRQACLPALRYRSYDDQFSIVLSILNSAASLEFQRAAFQLVFNQNPDVTTSRLLESWQSLGPQGRTIVIPEILIRRSTILMLLHAMQAGTVSPTLLNIEQRDPLLMTTDQEILSLAEQVIGQSINKDRLAVITSYQKALDIAGDAQKGKLVFQKICAQCHKVGGIGHDVGPDLSDIRAKGNKVLLADILDPSSAVEPRWTSYTAVLEDGRVFNGLLVRESENAIVLRKAEAIEDTLPRDEIELLRPATQSLMPSGIETEISIEQMADLLAFLKGGN